MAAIFMIFNAWYVGRAFDDYTERGYVVGEYDEVEVAAEQEFMDLAMNQNIVDEDEAGTSCALDDDDNIVGALEEGQQEEGDNIKVEVTKE